MAQSTGGDKSRLQNFGWSLQKVENKKESFKNKEQNTTNRENDDDEIIRIDTTLIVNEILVFDKHRNPVSGLKKEDFIISEDDRLQEIEVFTLGDNELIPRSIVLIIDHSSSQLPYIKTSIEAAKVLIDKLNPQDRMAIVTDDVVLLQDFTSDKNLLKEKLESLKQSTLSGKTGRSRQLNALMATLNEMFGEEDLRPVIIFQTDGDELFHLKASAQTKSRK